MNETSSSSSSFTIEATSRLLDMESIKSYSTTDEYVYAMKEDLAEWFNTMYLTNLTAENFMDLLENGALICQHANSVIRAVNEANKKVNQQTIPFPPIYYKNDAKSQSFQARDNVSNFIKWCRNSVKVRECLMFETDDLILRKNEKHVILCLLEIARYGSKFGLQVPTIIKMEQEIEKEENELIDTQNSNEFSQKLSFSCDYDDTNKDEENSTNSLNDSLETDIKSSISISISPPSSLTSSTSSISINKTQNQQIELINELKATSSVSSLSPPTSSSSISLIENHQQQQVEQEQEQQQQNSKVKLQTKRNLNNEFQKSGSNGNKLNKLSKPKSRSSSINKLYNRSRSNSRNIELETDLEKHVNKIVNRCTCEKKFPVIQISEGKYRIGNTKTIVFIRILRNHIMVRVGGGWDTLENYLNKHDPCRNPSCNHINDPNSCCHSVSQQINSHQKISNDNNSKYIIHYDNNNTSSTPILLRPIDSLNNNPRCNINNNINNNNNIGYNNNQLIVNSNQIIISTPFRPTQQLKISESGASTPSLITKYPLQQNTYQLVGFTDAQLIIQRDQQLQQQQHQQQGKEIDTTSNINADNFNISSSLKETLKHQTTNPQSHQIRNELVNDKMNSNYDRNNMNRNNINMNTNSNSYSNRTSTTKMNEFLNKNYILQQHLQQQQHNKYDYAPSITSSPYSYSSTNSSLHQQYNTNQNSLTKTESVIKSKMKKLINKFPNQHHTHNYQQQANNSYLNENNANLISSKHIDSNEQPYKTITSYDNNTLVVSTNNNLDYMMFLPDTPVYTETNLPPRILRKYQKKASTEKISSTDSDDVFELNQPKTQLNENDLVDLAKTIQDIYQIDDDIIDDYNNNNNNNNNNKNKNKNNYNVKSTNQIVYNSNKSIAPPPPSNAPPVIRVSPIKNVNKTSENTLTTYSSDQACLKNEKLKVPSSMDKFIPLDKNITEMQKNDAVKPITVTQSRLTGTSSPKAPPRTKIKYRKSKTCELKIMKAGEYLENDDDDEYYEYETKEENSGIQEIHADSLENINENSNTNNNNSEKFKDTDIILETQKYTFSLNYLNNDKNKFLKFIPLNNPHQIDIDELFKPNESDILNDSLEPTQNENKVLDSIFSNTTSSPQIGTNFKRTNSRRARWDKSPQILDFKYFNQEPKKQNIVLPMVNNEQIDQKTKCNLIAQTKTDNLNNLNQVINNYAMNTSKPIAAVIATPKLTQPNDKPDEISKFDDKSKLELLSKKSRNLDLAKQKLVEMKKTMDAKMLVQTNIDSKSSNNNSTVLKKTTKTTNNNDVVQKQTQKIHTTRTTPRKIKKRSGERSLTAGLVLEHEINDKTEIKKNEIEFKQTFGTSPKKSSSNSQLNQTVYKSQTQISQSKSNQKPQRSTSASSLIKQHANDSCSDIVSIRNRRDSIASNTSSTTNCTISSGMNEYKENKASELRKIANLKNKILTKQLDPIYTRNNPVATEIMEAQSEQSKKRLFAKKNEKSWQEHTILQTDSSNFIVKASNDLSRLINEEKPVSKKAINNKTEPSKSKSTTDLYYNFERTNSTLDLLELINDCDIPKADPNQYKLMVIECEKLEKSIKPTNKTSTLLKLSQNTTKNSKQMTRDKINQKGTNKTRSQSAPSYTRNPIINIVDYDEEQALKNVQ